MLKRPGARALPPPVATVTTPSRPALPATSGKPDASNERKTDRPPAAPSTAPARRAALSQQDRDSVMNLELVRQVVDLFDARLVDMQKRPTVKPPEPDETDIDNDEESSD